MHSGRGEEASDNTYRLLPIPQEPHVPATGEAREGVVLPAHGEQWEHPTQVVQPAPGQPWGESPQLPAQPGGDGTGADAEKTQLIPPPGSPDAERTQLLAPQGRQESESTQLLPPFSAQSHQAAPMRQPLPPEQGFGAALPPPPANPPMLPGQPPMPPAPPFAIRPGAPADHLEPQQAEGVAAATQRLPRYEEPPTQQAHQQPQQPQPQQPPAQQPQAQQQSAQDDYDYLYRREGQATASAQPTTAYGAPQYGAPQYGAPQYGAPQYGAAQQSTAQYGYDQSGTAPGSFTAPEPASSSRRGKLSPPALIGIIVAACAVVGLAAGAILSNGGDEQNAGATSSASASAAGAGDATQQAKELDALLGDSNSSRSKVINAVATIKSCGNLPQAAADLRSAAGQRNDLVTRLAKLNVDKLPNHDQLVTELNTAWQASAAADEHYAAWADQADCTKGHAKATAEAQQGNRSSGEATIAKRAAAELWNPIARQYGLTQRQYTEL